MDDDAYNHLLDDPEEIITIITVLSIKSLA